MFDPLSSTKKLCFSPLIKNPKSSLIRGNCGVNINSCGIKEKKHRFF